METNSSKPLGTTTVSSLVDDQGGGGLYCDSCGFFEGWAFVWKVCPNCKRVVTYIEPAEPYPFGGSDF
jgi:hypothetical protein